MSLIVNSKLVAIRMSLLFIEIFFCVLGLKDRIKCKKKKIIFEIKIYKKYIYCKFETRVLISTQVA
jgi:hypothetical protein